MEVSIEQLIQQQIQVIYKAQQIINNNNEWGMMEYLPSAINCLVNLSIVAREERKERIAMYQSEDSSKG